MARQPAAGAVRAHLVASTAVELAGDVGGGAVQPDGDGAGAEGVAESVFVVPAVGPSRPALR